MRRLFVLALGVWASIHADAGALGQTPGGGIGRLIPPRTALEKIGLERQWHAVVPIANVSEKILQISKTDDLITVQTDRARFFAFDAETGAKRWDVKLGALSTYALPVASNEKLLFVANLTNVIALDRATGHPTFTQHLDAIPACPLVANAEQVLVTLLNGGLTVYNMRPPDKTVAYIRESDGRTFYRSALYSFLNYRSSLPILSRPILTRKVIAIGAQDGRLMVVANQERNPSTLFRFTTNGPITAPLGSLGQRTVLVPSQDRTLYAVDLFTGDLIWYIATSAPLLQRPLVSGQFVYIQNAAGEITAVDLDRFWAIVNERGSIEEMLPADQQKQAHDRAFALDQQDYDAVRMVYPQSRNVRAQALWTETSSPGELLAVSPTRIYGRNADHVLFVLDRAKGSVLYRSTNVLKSLGLDTRELTMAVVNEETDRIYLASPTGLIVCLREIGRDAPALLIPKRERIFGDLPEFDVPPPEDEAKKAEAEGDADNP